MNRRNKLFLPCRVLLKAIAITGFLALAGCQSPDRVIFVTNSNISVGYDAATATGHVGYKRVEAYVGPAYPETGAIPPVVASLQSDMRFIAPSVSQLYATGDAALIATKKKDVSTSTEPEARWADIKDRRLAIVGTSSHVGFIVQTMDLSLAKVDFGYGRQEASMLPLRNSSQSGKDIYPSVLASITVKPSGEDTAIGDGAGGLKLTQFIATGGAAEALAARPDVRSSFDVIARSAAKDAAESAAKTLGFTDDEYSALVSEGDDAAKNAKARVDNIVLKLLGVAAGNRTLTGEDQAKIQAAAKQLNGSVDDTATLAGKATSLAALPNVEAVRYELGLDNDLINALHKLLSSDG